MDIITKKAELDRSQSEIVMSEEVFPNSALNTISVTMFFEKFSAEEAARACDMVLESADVFSAALVKENNSYFFCPRSKAIKKCSVSSPKTREEAEAHIAKLDRQHMDFPRELYSAEAFDIAEGGSALTLRSHHVLMDGYGMSVFAQRVTDVLEGRDIPISEFFGDLGNVAADPEKDAAFWREYFADNDSEPVVFGEKAEGCGKTTVPFAVSEEVQSAALNIAERCGVTLPYVYAAAYSIYLRGATGKPDVVFLMARAGRTPEQSDIIGCYTLVVPVRVHISADDSFDDACRAVSASAKDASAHKSIGFTSIMKTLREEYGMTEPSMYGFNWYNKVLQSDTPIRLRFSTSGEMRDHLMWNIFADKDGISSDFACRDGVYDA